MILINNIRAERFGPWLNATATELDLTSPANKNQKPLVCTKKDN